MVAILFILAALKVGVSVERTFFQREPEIHIRIVILLKLKSISTFNIPFVKNRMLTYRIDQDYLRGACRKHNSRNEVTFPCSKKKPQKMAKIGSNLTFLIHFIYLVKKRKIDKVYMPSWKINL